MEKKKVLNVLKNIWLGVATVLSVGFITVCGVACSQTNNVQVACAESEVIKLDSQVNKKLVSYNDEDYEITLSGAELQYSYENFYNNFLDNYYQDILLSYDGHEYTYYSTNTESISYSYNTSSWISFLFDYIGYDTIPPFDKNYVFFDFGNDVYLTGPLKIVITSSSEDYLVAKQYIELDIQANSSTINDGIFETLSGSVVAFIGSLSSGITAMTSVFYDSGNSQLTTIGLLSVIVVAVSLAYFLFRLIIGLIRMRG